MISKDRLFKTLSFINIRHNIKALFILIIKWIENIESSLSSKADLIDGKIPDNQLPNISNSDILDLSNITSIDDELNNKIQNASIIKLNGGVYLRSSNSYRETIMFLAVDSLSTCSGILYNSNTKTVEIMSSKLSSIYVNISGATDPVPENIFTKDFFSLHDLRTEVNDISIEYRKYGGEIFPVVILSVGRELSEEDNPDFTIDTNFKYSVLFTLNNILYFGIVDNSNNFIVKKQQSIYSLFK